MNPNHTGLQCFHQEYLVTYKTVVVSFAPNDQSIKTSYGYALAIWVLVPLDYTAACQGSALYI